jgi:hypothetical protein
MKEEYTEAFVVAGDNDASARGRTTIDDDGTVRVFDKKDNVRLIAHKNRCTIDIVRQ